MPSYTHKKLTEEIFSLDTLPADAGAFRRWLTAEAHLNFLDENARSDEIVIYASGPHSFVHSIVVPDDQLQKVTDDDLLHWSCNPYTSIASYVSGGGRKGMWVERGGKGRGSAVLDSGNDLIFARTFEGWSGAGRIYFEANQEYTHLSGVHWRPEEQAYCRFDQVGDIRHVISVTAKDRVSEISLVTFKWQELEEYLLISKQSLFRMFDFTLIRHDLFTGWPNTPDARYRRSDDFLYRQRDCGDAAFTRGAQIIRARSAGHDTHEDITNGWTGYRDKKHVEFLADDWRNKRLTKISTDPKATTNYFEAAKNSLPFELSPAFFRAEVLSKYKTDREKYTVKDREVICRAAWHLRGYDVNEAGQIHAYICDLRSLPYSELLHWLSFNVKPKTGISKRALTNDFKGDFVAFTHPRERIMSIARRWHERGVVLWKLRDHEFLNRANIPLTSSKDEWSEAVMDIVKLVIEGFEIKPLRERLDKSGTPYNKDDRPSRFWKS